MMHGTMKTKIRYFIVFAQGLENFMPTRALKCSVNDSVTGL